MSYSSFTYMWSGGRCRDCLLVSFTGGSGRIRVCFRQCLGSLSAFFVLLRARFKAGLAREGSLVVFSRMRVFPRTETTVGCLITSTRGTVGTGGSNGARTEAG